MPCGLFLVPSSPRFFASPRSCRDEDDVARPCVCDCVVHSGDADLTWGFESLAGATVIFVRGIALGACCFA